MKIALLTDPHWGARNDSLIFINYYEEFYKNIFFPKLKEDGIKTLLMLGDTFDRRKYINFVTLSHAKRIFFDRLSEEGISTYILAGNHDTAYKNTNEINSIDLLLKEYENIQVIDVPMTIHLNFENESNDIFMSPWICSDNYHETLELIKRTDASICCGHFEIEGFSMYRGHTSDEGLSRDLFRKFDYTFSGHYHHKSSSGSIYYLGNPYELTWQDYNDDRGFHIFDLDSRNLEFCKNPYTMFHRLSYDDSELELDLQQYDFGYLKNRYVKVIVINKTNPYFFDRYMDLIYSSDPSDVKIVEDFSDSTEGLEEDMINQAEDTLTLLNKYIDGVESHLDNNKLKNIMRELYLESLSNDIL